MQIIEAVLKIPLLIISLLFYFFLAGCIMTAVFCRVMKRHSRKKSVSVSAQKHSQSPQSYSMLRSDIFSFGFGLTRYYTIICGKIPSHNIRKWLYRHMFCMKVHPKAIIYGGCEFRAPWNIYIGKSVIGNNCVLDGRNGINIDDRVCLGGSVFLWTAQHNVNNKYFGTDGKTGPITICRHAWIASRSTVLPNITIEEGAVIACGAVVTKNCEAFGIYGGVAAKKISERSHDLEYDTVTRSYMWFY